MRNNGPGFAFAIVGLAIMLVGIAIGVGQAALWLRSGVWPAFPVSQIWALLSDGRTRPSAEWGGLQQILSWAFEQSAAFALLCVGGALAGLGSVMIETH